MAEDNTTLGDVIKRLRAEGDLSRNSGTHSIKSVKEILEDSRKSSLSDKEDKREQGRRDEKQIDLLEQMARNGATSNDIINNKASLPTTGMAGLGVGLLGAGVGLGAAGAGLGAFFMGLSGAEAIMQSFGEGGNLKKLLTNLSEGLASFETRDLAALGAVLGFGAAAGAVPGLSGAAAGMGMGAVGLGLAAFFVGLAAADKTMAWLDTDYTNLPKMATSISDTFANFDEDAMKGMATILGVGAIAGGLFGIGKTAKATIGMAAISAGIAAFFVGLSAADGTANWLDTDGSKLKPLMVNFSEGMSALVADDKVFGTLAAMMAGAAGTALFGVGATAKATVGMGLLGAGIAAFFVALGAGDKGLDWMNTDGSKLKSLMTNLADGLKAFSGSHLAVLATAMTGTGILAATGVGVVGVAAGATGLGILGAGLGAFFAGLGLGDAALDWMGADGSGIKKLMTNTATGLNELATVDFENLKGASVGMGSAAAGMIALLGVDGLSKLTNTITDGVKGIWNWITGNEDDKEKKGIVQQVVDMLEPLNSIDAKQFTLLEQLTTSLSLLGDSMRSLEGIDLSDLKDTFQTLGQSVAFSIPLVSAMYNGGPIGAGWFDGYDSLDFGPGLKNMPLTEVEKRMKKLRGTLQFPTINSVAENVNAIGDEMQNLNEEQKREEIKNAHPFSQMNMSGDTITDTSQNIAVLNAMSSQPGGTAAGMTAQGLAIYNYEQFLGANSN
jgi:hypothetical protein